MLCADAHLTALPLDREVALPVQRRQSPENGPLLFAIRFSVFHLVYKHNFQSSDVAWLEVLCFYSVHLRIQKVSVGNTVPFLGCY